MYSSSEYPLRSQLQEEHATGWDLIGKSGPFWTGADRVAMARETRLAVTCELCRKRKAALSPNMVQGKHDSDTHLPLVIVDAIHRLQSDPSRFTKSVFDHVIASGFSVEQYVEMVSVVCTTIIIDGMHNAMACGSPPLPDGDDSSPRGQEVAETVEDGAWVPLSPRDDQLNALGIPRSANILRSMGAVPEAVDLFFRVFRSHYLLMGAPLDIPRAQIEYIASLVSALNECFY